MHETPCPSTSCRPTRRTYVDVRMAMLSFRHRHSAHATHMPATLQR